MDCARLTAKLMRLNIRWADALWKTVSEAAADCSAAAMRLAPEGTGRRTEKRLKSSFFSHCTRQKEIFQGICMVENPHAAYVEFATGRRGAATGAGAEYDPDWPGMAAQPYMQPAADEQLERFPAAAAEALRRVTGGNL